ncbi:Bcr/CflA family drug resistance efflux transporter [Solemya pervernicosa gill symbiont]|uniref:Bcr/CflA family efflux transporter n=3 Tax=Gammaproteobacteria incertae sedis TaxID=118884 RepID=A0A1T2L2A5_9GAMM|nr:Bcr/CflA family drug resistance efflux transporter [Solemya pervernicosa gill symbiont]QKQ28359.1 multidrug effflux MFS transporter [Candidatus Reidiella endopervernicosa]
MLAMLAPFTIDTYLPSFPSIASEFGASDLQLQQTLSLYLLAFAVSTLIYGPLSDGFGRRGVVLLALLVYVASSVGAALVVDIDQLIVMRILQGLSASAGLVVGRAMVRDLYHGHEAHRVMAMVMMLFAIAPAVAPLVGGLLQSWLGWRSVFLFLALLGALVTLLFYLGIRETLPRDKRHSIHPLKVGRLYLNAFVSPRFMGLTIAFSLMFGGFFLYVAGAPVVIFEHLGLKSNDFWLLFIPLVSGMAVGSMLSRRMAGRIAPEWMLAAGFLIMVVAGLLNVAQSLWLETTPLTVIAPLTLYTFGVALVIPILTVMGLDCFPKNRGMASAMQGFLQMSYGALVAGALVPLFAHALTSLAMAMLLQCVVATLIWLAVESFTEAPVEEDVS